MRMVVLVTPCACAPPADSRNASAQPTAVNIRFSFILPTPSSVKYLSFLCARFRSLLEELAAPPDHRQVDEFRPAVAAGREADDEFAQVDVVHAFQGGDELLAR